MGTLRKTKSDLGAAELRTTEQLHSLVGRLLTLLADHFGGDTTLNHLRIGNYIGQCSHYQNQPTSNSEIAKHLNISRPTVSRIVNHFISAGWVIETTDPEDGRRRRLDIKPMHPDSDRFERAFRAEINDLLRLFEEGEIVVVDTSKRSF